MRGDKPRSAAQCIPTPSPLLVGHRRFTQATTTILRTVSSHRVLGLPIAALICAVLTLHHDEATAAATSKPNSGNRTGKLATTETPLTVVHKFVYSNERICGDIFGDGKWLPAKHRCRLDCRLGVELCQMRSTVDAAAATAKEQRCLRLPEECQRRLKALLDDFHAKTGIDPFADSKMSSENIDASTENSVTPTTVMPFPPFMRKSSGNFVAPPPSDVASGRRGGPSLPARFSSIQERPRPYDKHVGGGRRPPLHFDDTAGQLTDAVRQPIAKFEALFGITPTPPSSSTHQRQSAGPPAPPRPPDGAPPSSSSSLSSIPTLPPPQIPPHLTAKPVSTLDVVVEPAQSSPRFTEESVELVPFSTDDVLLPLPEVVLSGASTFPPPRPSTTPPPAFFPSSMEIQRTTLPLAPVSSSSESKSLTQTFGRVGNSDDQAVKSSTPTSKFTSAYSRNPATTKRSATEHLVTKTPTAATSPLPFDVDAALEHNYHVTNKPSSSGGNNNNNNHRTPLRIYSTVWSVRPTSTTTPTPSLPKSTESNGRTPPTSTTVTVDPTTSASIDDSDTSNFFADIDTNNIFGIEQNPFNNIDGKHQQQQQQSRQKMLGTTTTVLASLPGEVTVTAPTKTLLHSLPNGANTVMLPQLTTTAAYPMLPLKPKMTSFSWKMTSSSAEPRHDGGNHIDDNSSPYALVDYSMEAQNRRQKHWRGGRPPPYGNLGYYGSGSRGAGDSTPYGYSNPYTNNNEVSAEIPSAEVLSPPSRRREYQGEGGYDLITSGYAPQHRNHYNNRDSNGASRANDQTEEDVIHIFGPPMNPATPDASKVIMPSSAENGMENPSMFSPYDPIPYMAERRTAEPLPQSHSPRTFNNNNNGNSMEVDEEDSRLRKNDSFVMRSGELDENSSDPQQQLPAQQHSQQLLNTVARRRGNFLNSLQQVEFSTEKDDQNLRKNMHWWVTTSVSNEMAAEMQMKSNFTKRPYYAQALILDRSVRCCQWALDGLCDRSWQRIRRLCPKSCGNVVCTSAEGTLSCNRVIDVNVIDCYAQRKRLKSFIANFRQQLSVEEAEHQQESAENSQPAADDENRAGEERSRTAETTETTKRGTQQLSRENVKKNGMELLAAARKHYADTSPKLTITTVSPDAALQWREYAIEDEIKRFNLLNKKEKLTKSNFTARLKKNPQNAEMCA